jgi:NAD-dependent deacetylase
VWFGEAVPMIDRAAELVSEADIIVIIGTSMQVYPAAGLVRYAKHNTPIYFIDPKPTIRETDFENLTIIQSGAVDGTITLADLLLQS